MTFDGKRRALAALVSACAITLIGCGGAKVSPKTEALAGVWIEVVKADPGSNPRIPQATKPPANVRRFTFEADQKFRFEICSSKGKPIAGQEFSGTWSEDGQFLTLTLAEAPAGDFASWAPVRTRGVTEVSTANGPVKRIRVTDVDGNTVLYKPAE